MRHRGPESESGGTPMQSPTGARVRRTRADTAPPRANTCGRCWREWTSGIECHCSGCCAHFANVRAFDSHQSAAKGCHDPRELRRRNGDPVLVARLSSRGTTWHRYVAGEPWRGPRTVEGDGGAS